MSIEQTSDEANIGTQVDENRSNGYYMKFGKEKKMRNPLTFQTYVALMAILMLSLPLLSLAEQTPTAIAKADAELDASRDTNKTVWFLSGMVPVCLVSAVTVAIVSNTVGTYEEVSCIFWMGCISLFVGPVAAIRSSPSPSVERLIGKSPEYILAYTYAYKSKARRLQVQSAAGGVATGCCVSIAGSLFILLSSDTSFGPTL